jgi:Zn-finger nucleic acid-binding protein
MDIVEFGTDITIRRCTGCKGIFCTRETLQDLRDEWHCDAVLDKGNPAQGARRNEMLNVICPDCGSAMEHIADAEQPHITLDSCTGCDGVFLDAGELTDMKSVTLMDHFRRLLTKRGK